MARVTMLGRLADAAGWRTRVVDADTVGALRRALERRFGPALAVVGVHSGKFIAERATERIAHAAARLGVAHPVANDRQFRTWRAWAARGWPTLAVVDARGQTNFILERTDSLVEMGYIKRKPDRASIDWTLLEQVIAENPELYAKLKYKSA